VNIIDIILNHPILSLLFIVHKNKNNEVFHSNNEYPLHRYSTCTIITKSHNLVKYNDFCQFGRVSLTKSQIMNQHFIATQKIVWGDMWLSLNIKCISAHLEISVCKVQKGIVQNMDWTVGLDWFLHFLYSWLARQPPWHKIIFYHRIDIPCHVYLWFYQWTLSGVY
jgi:hypothetical protein